eukprot:COSAG02_NODE_2851_length_7896_cov_28.878928_3_plen_37_part_00
MDEGEEKLMQAARRNATTEVLVAYLLDSPRRLHLEP